MQRVGIKLCILAVGSVLLLALELSYSVALERYKLKGESTPLFNGPIAAVIRSL